MPTDPDLILRDFDDAVERLSDAARLLGASAAAPSDAVTRELLVLVDAVEAELAAMSGIAGRRG
jgi:hypothetical protein